MPDQIIDTLDATITISDRLSGDGRGRAQTISVVAKPNSLGANAEQLRQRALAALDANTAFLAVGAPTQAQILTQVQRLTRESSGLIRLLLGLTDDITGT